MRTLAVGDIHGCFRALQALMEQVNPTDKDRLITLGDYVDRGPDSHAVLDWLIAQQKKCELIALRGNHEEMMLAGREDPEHRQDWLHCGGRETLASYAPEGGQGKLMDIPDKHWEFLEQTQSWFELDKHFFVHANVHPELPLDEQPDYMLYWEPLFEPIAHVSGKTMICGHTRQKDGLPKNYGHTICIDTWVYGPGWLTCLEVETGRYWQANQNGNTQSGWLEEEG